MSYILGTREFWGLPFEVGPDVLIPRPGDRIHRRGSARAGRKGFAAPSSSTSAPAADASPSALAREIPGARVIATDVSTHALEVARRNAVRHGVADRITFVETSFLDGIEEGADLIVSNPPYVPSVSQRGLTPEVRDYEPPVALFGGEDGLDGLRSVLEGAACEARAGRVARHGVRLRPGRLRHRARARV